MASQTPVDLSEDPEVTEFLRQFTADSDPRKVMEKYRQRGNQLLYGAHGQIPPMMEGYHDHQLTPFKRAEVLYWKTKANRSSEEYQVPPGLERSGSHYSNPKSRIVAFNQFFADGIDIYKETFVRLFDQYLDWLETQPHTSDCRDARIEKILDIGEAIMECMQNPDENDQNDEGDSGDNPGCDGGGAKDVIDTTDTGEQV